MVDLTSLSTKELKAMYEQSFKFPQINDPAAPLREELAYRGCHRKGMRWLGQVGNSEVTGEVIKKVRGNDTKLERIVAQANQSPEGMEKLIELLQGMLAGELYLE